jgi:RimJ/RimL family protein N-acetyltransferase
MKRFPSREENRERMLKACNLDSPTVVSITLNSEIIGHSSLTPLNPGVDAGIHFQIWRENLERQGLAQALALPLLIFWFRLYSLQLIYADASADHAAVNALMQRFSVPSLGTHIAPSSTFLKERLVHRYQVTRKWLEDRGGLNLEV